MEFGHLTHLISENLLLKADILHFSSPFIHA